MQGGALLPLLFNFALGKPLAGGLCWRWWYYVRDRTYYREKHSCM